MIHRILRFTLVIAICCVLHRCKSQDIHCQKLSEKFLPLAHYCPKSLLRSLPHISLCTPSPPSDCHRPPSQPFSTKSKDQRQEAFEKPSSQIKPFATQVAQDANESESPTTPSLRKTRPTYSLSHALSIATKSSPIRKTNSQPPSSLLVICRY